MKIQSTGVTKYPDFYEAYSHPNAPGFGNIFRWTLQGIFLSLCLLNPTFIFSENRIHINLYF